LSAPSSEGSLRLNWRGIVAAIACISIVGTGLSVTLPLLSIVMEREGVPASIIGANVAVGGLAIMLIAPFTSDMVVRFGVVRLLAGAIVLAAASMLAIYLTPPPWPWFAFRFAFGIAISLLFVVSEFWINALVDDGRRGLVMGLYGTVLSIGFAAGPALLTVTGTEGFAPYGVTLLLFGLGAIPVFFAAGAAPRVIDRSRRPFLSILFAAPAATMAGLTFGAVESTGFGLLPVYGMRVGYSAEEATTLITAMALGGVLFQLPMGLLSDHMDRRLVLLGSALASMIFIALLPLAPFGLAGALISAFLFGGLAGALYSVGLAHLGSRFRGADLASANAAFVMLYAIGMLVGPAAAGIGMDLWQPHGFIAVLAAMLALFCLIVGIRLMGARRGGSW
jgi:MFS family permease